VPHEVHLAIERGTETPRVDYPPIRFYRFSGSAFSEGIEVQALDNVSVRIYGREKTVVDCFKYRNKIGLDVAIEALRLWRQRKGSKVETLMKMARVCRVENVMRPYVESVL
jgi:predicted transcriptional regulator of viral defense system